MASTSRSGPGRQPGTCPTAGGGLWIHFGGQMEVYAGYCENADWNAGRMIAAVEEMGELDNTVVIYIFGDNGASMEGTLTGSFNKLTMQNGIPLTAEQQLA